MRYPSNNNNTHAKISKPDIGTAAPLGTIDHGRRAIDLLGARATEQGRRRAAVLTEVEVDVDVCHQAQARIKSASLSLSFRLDRIPIRKKAKVFRN